MRIAIDISQVIYGTGVAEYTRHLVTHLTKIGEKHQWILFGGSLRRKNELDRFTYRLPNSTRKTNYLSPNMANILWNSFHVFPIENLIGKVDLVHTSDWAEPPAKSPKVTTVHDLNFFHDPEFALPSIRAVQHKRLFWVARESQIIIAVSQATKADLVKYLDIDPERIVVIHEGPMLLQKPEPSDQTIDIVKRKFGITKPFFLVPGAGHPRKNVKNIIQAFQKYNNDFQLVISGRASEEEKEAVSKGVIFTGFNSEIDMGVLFTQAQACVYPSLYEGFGIPILDAFTCQIPVVTSNVSSMPEVAGNAAVLVNPESPEEIACGIIKALEDKHVYITRGLEQLTRFSWEKTAKDTLRIYEHTIEGLR